MTFEFAGFELDESLYQLRRGGEVLKVEPKVFDVLAYLVRHRERVVSKDELLGQLWPGEFVTESVLPSNVAALRRLLGDDRSGQRFIKTVYGRGYQFVAAVRETRPAAPRAAARGPETPFVGRAEVLVTLERALADALGGAGRLLALVGEPGIGKTRTIEELAVHAWQQGARVLVARSFEGEGAPAFWPWVQILRAALRDRADDSLRAELGERAAELASLVPELRRRLPEIPERAALDPEAARFRQFEAVAAYLRDAAALEPLMIVLDDLHWADRPSLLLLQFLARELRDARVLLVGAYRDVEVRRGQPLAHLLGQLASEPSFLRVPLRGIDPEAIREFIEGTTGHRPSKELIASIHERTEGNPYFVGEITRLLDAEGRLDATAAGRTPLPEGVREAIGRRLDALSPECNRVLGLASLLGREFRVPPLERLAGLPVEQVLDRLDEAIEARVLKEVPRSVGRYAFAHALVRETLYEELTGPRRVRLHRQAGEVLEELYGADPEALLEELAYHFFQAAPAGQVAKAVEYGRRAAEHALGLLAFEEAVRHYEQALEALELEPPEGAQRCELLLALGDAWSRAGERERSRAAFQRAAEDARRVGRPDLLAQAAIGMGGRGEWGWGPDPPMRALLDEARAALGDSRPDLRARVLARLSGIHPYMQSRATRLPLSTEAVELARETNDRHVLLEALDARTFEQALGPPTAESVEERLALGSEFLALAASSPDGAEGHMGADPAFRGHYIRLSSYLGRGEMAAVDREFGEMVRIAEQQRLPYQRYGLASVRFGRAHLEGRFADAEARMAECRAMARQMSLPNRSLWLVQAFVLARERGPAGTHPRLMDPATAARFIDITTRDYPWLASPVRSIVAHGFLGLGRGDVAVREFETVVEQGFEGGEGYMGWHFMMCLLAELAVAFHDEPRAEELYALLAPYGACIVRGIGGDHCLGPAEHFLGILAALLGRGEAAEGHFRAALEMSARTGARPSRARSALELGALLRGRRGRGERDEAERLLAEAAEGVRELGIGALEPRLTELGV